MGTARPPEPAKLVAGLLVGNTELLPVITEVLEREFGPVDLKSELMDFSFTRYYEPELGPNIKRQFFSFARLIDPGTLAEIKVRTNCIEQDLAYGGRRVVNIDPGYVTKAKLVLATTKDYAHRIYLAQGIYAEVTLSYSRGEFQPLPWTYPDYQTKAYRDFFRRVRDVYREQVRAGRIE